MTYLRSNYPTTIDKLKTLPIYQDMTIEDKRMVGRYQVLVEKNNLTPDEQVELSSLVERLRDKMINSEDWNQLIGAVLNLETYFKDNVLDHIDNKLSGLNTIAANTVNTVEKAKNDAIANMDSVKTETINSLNRIGAETTSEIENTKDGAISEISIIKNEATQSITTSLNQANDVFTEMKRIEGDFKTDLPILNDCVERIEQADEQIKRLQDASNSVQDDIAKIESVGNKEILIRTSEWTLNGDVYEKEITHDLCSENLHVTAKNSDTKEAVTIGYKILDKTRILLKSDEAIPLSLILSASFYNPLITSNVDEGEIVRARKGESGLDVKIAKVDEQLDNITSVNIIVNETNIDEILSDDLTNKYIIFSNNIKTLSKQYILNGNNYTLDFNNNEILYNASVSGSLFNFNNCRNVKVKNGFLKNNILPKTNITYFAFNNCIEATISNMTLYNVGNGGINVTGLSQDIIIENVIINGKCDYSTCRGIWINGAGIEGFNSQYVNTDNFTRNNIPFPLQILNITIKNCAIKMSAYGIYLMNTKNNKIINCNIDISGSTPQRCVAVNNYSPNTLIQGCTLVSNASSTGILVTQCSENVIITDNIFRGSFGGNRCVYIQYLANAVIKNNIFNTNGSRQIQINTGGYGEIINNVFNAVTYSSGKRGIDIDTLDSAISTNEGSTVTLLKGSIIKDNIFRNCTPVILMLTASNNGNIGGYDTIIFEDNKHENIEVLVGGLAYGFYASSNSLTNITNIYCGENIALTTSKNDFMYYPRTEGAGVNVINNKLQQAIYKITYKNSSWISEKISGGIIACTPTKSGKQIKLVTRTQNGNSGAKPLKIVGFSSIANSACNFIVTEDGNNHLITIKNSNNEEVVWSEGLSFYVHLAI